MRRKRLFDISCIAAGILTLGSVSMAITYAAGYGDLEYLPPVVEMVPYVLESERPQPRRNSPVSVGQLIQTDQTEESVKAEMHPAFAYGREWSDEDKYLLAKIAMAEAEGSTIQCMSLVIMVVLNRVESDCFPNSIREVIFQYDEKSGIYQFSCIGNGRWDRVEPDQSCYEAVSVVQDSVYDYSDGALYFESCWEEDNWHSRHLDFLYQCGELRFYR